MKKIIFIILLFVFVSCGLQKKTVSSNSNNSSNEGYDWRVTVSSLTTSYDDQFYPTYHFTLKNNTSKTISTFEATLVITYVNKQTKEYVGKMTRNARWQTTLAPGQTHNYYYSSDDRHYDYDAWKYIYSCKSVRVTAIRFSDGTASY